jgi:hypothetical protein
MTHQVGDPQRTTPMQKFWADASAKYVVEQAGKVRESAAKWGQSATAILAATGLATAFAGRETLAALDPTAHFGIIVAVVAAAALSGVSLFCAAWAASRSSGWTWDDPESFRSSQETAAATSSRWLSRSAVFLLAAFTVAIIAVVLTLTAPKAAGTSQTLVVSEGDIVGCGELTVANGQLRVDGTAVPPAPVSFHTLSECPD